MSTAAALDLLSRSEESLADAASAQESTHRYLQAHLAALRAAAALVASRATSASDRARVGAQAACRPRSLWVLVALHAPELGEWADFFALSTTRRGVIESGGSVSAREADDLLRQSESFVDLVVGALGLPHRERHVDLLAPARG